MRIRLRNLCVIAIVMSLSPVFVMAADLRFEQRIDELLARMTLEEKIGQLMQPLYDRDDRDLLPRIEQGLVGSLCVTESRIFTPEQRNEIQRIAVEKSRLGIPLLFGFDVVHGFSTIFPIPLGLSASWDEKAVEESASIAAREAVGYGIDKHFLQCGNRTAVNNIYWSLFDKRADNDYITICNISGHIFLGRIQENRDFGFYAL